MLNSSYNVYAA